MVCLGDELRLMCSVISASTGSVSTTAAGLNNSRIMVFTGDGKFIKTFGTRGTGDGQLISPHALAFDSKDRLYVAARCGL
jgi:hypothetical protein